MATGSPPIVTTGSNDDAQAQLMQAILAQMKPEQAAPIQAALAEQARRVANKKYMRDSKRKLGVALTNGIATQAYALNTPLTFNLQSALNGYIEGFVLRYVVNYTLATGTSAVYGLTPSGSLGFIDTYEVRYNKSQIKDRPISLRQLSLAGALDEYVIPEAAQPGGFSQSGINSYTNTAAPVSTGANQVVQQFYVPFNFIAPDDPRGVLPFMAGDTGIQIIVNTPLALFGADPILNAFYAVSGTGHAVSAVSGTVEIMPVYRDGDTYNNTAKLPFDITALKGTAQVQIDQVLAPLVAGTTQLTKLNIMGYHYYVVLLIVDGVQSSSLALNSNIAYIGMAKDGIGGNKFEEYGTQTNKTLNDYWFLERLNHRQDLDQGVLMPVHAPLDGMNTYRDRRGNNYLDNTRTGWADWRWGVNVTAVGTVCNPRVEPHVYYINPTGLVPV
jgi:hypothetical protein